MKIRPIYIFLTAGVLVFGGVWSVTRNKVASPPAKDQLAAVGAYAESITPFDLRQRYDEGRLKVLIVPGHDNTSWGTEYRGVREGTLTLDTSKHLYDYLKSDKHLQVSVARDLVTGEYIPELTQYFANNQEAIRNFVATHTINFASKVVAGQLSLVGDVYHNYAKADVAYRLNGINKWANENNIDLVIHGHFNDYPGHKYNKPGKYSGFTVYVPDSQYSNARASGEIGQAISTELQKVSPISDLPQESMPVVPDQDLIAVGAKGTRTGASILIEYGYIYEPQFNNPEVKSLILPELAYQTYAGLQKYFNPTVTLASSTLPILITENLQSGIRGSGQVLSLQKVLADKGYYPPTGKTPTDCPLNGNFGPCVESAVKNFQSSYGVNPTGVVGPITREKLNAP